METHVEVDDRYGDSRPLWSGDLPALPQKGSVVCLEKKWVVTEAQVYLKDPDAPCFWVHVKPKSLMVRIVGRLWWKLRSIRSPSKLGLSLRAKATRIRRKLKWLLKYIKRFT